MYSRFLLLVVLVTVGGALGLLTATGRLTDALAQENKAEAKAAVLVVDGSILPFPR